MKKIYKILMGMLTGISSIITLTIPVLAGDPWAVLYDNGRVYNAEPILPSIYRLLQTIGLLGCVLTTIFYIVQIIMHPQGARGVNAGKEGFKFKLMIAFIICTASFFMGLFFDFAYKLGGH